MEITKLFGKYVWQHDNKKHKEIHRWLNKHLEKVPELPELDQRRPWVIYYRSIRSEWKEFIRSWKYIPPRYLPRLPEGLKPVKMSRWSHEYTYRYPYKPATRDVLIDVFLGAGWEETYRDLKKGDDTITFKHPKMKSTRKVKLQFTAWEEGSVCQRVKIGSHMVEQDIYDYVCNEAALEMQEQAAAKEAANVETD